MVSLVFSCQKNELAEIQNEVPNVAQEDQYAFSKELAITLNQTEAIVRIHANTEWDLAAYSAENFQLVEVKNTESLEKALLRQGVMETSRHDNTKEEQDDESFTNEPEVASTLAFELVEINGKKDGSHYAISFFHPESSRKASWQYFTHYSTANGSVDEHCDIARHSVWRRVYYGLKYRRLASSNWSVIQNEWRKLSNNQTASYTRTPCFQYRARIKTKRSSAYTVSFY